MRKLAIFLLLVLCALPGFSQEKYFKEAIKNGRQQKQYYEIRNTKSKYISLDDVLKYCNQKDYIVGRYSIKEMGRFGDAAETVDQLLFIPRSEYGAYIFENISNNLPYSRLTGQGTVLFYERNSSTGNYYNRYSDVLWSGEVSNGMINGPGEGFKQLAPRRFIYFMGNFENGVPVGDVRYCIYESNDKYSFNNQYNKESKSSTGKLADGLCWFKYDDRSFGYINQSGTTVIKPRFSAVKDFSNGIAYVTEEGIDVKINKTGEVIAISEYAKMSFNDMVNFKKHHPNMAKSVEVLASKYVEGNLTFTQLVDVEKEFSDLKSKILPYKTSLYKKDVQQLESLFDKAVTAMDGSRYGEKEVAAFIDLYGKYNFDPDGKLPKARELRDYNTVCVAASQYVDTSSKLWRDYFPQKPSFNSDCYDQQSKLQDGYYICKNGGNTAFASYYERVESSLNDKACRLSRHIDSERSQYNAAMKKYEAKEKRKEEIVKSINAGNIYQYVIKEENWSRGRVFDSDDDFTDHRTVVFKNLDYLGMSYGDFSETIYETYNRERGIHYFSVSTGMFSSAEYTTYIDCLIKAFLKHYYREWRNNER